jgi:glycosyltransferase involved in cell wall biosynthesis
MQYVVYDKSDGKILMTRRGGNKLTESAAQVMFPSMSVGVWKMGNRFLDVKTNKIALNKDGSPRGIILFSESEEVEIERFSKPDVHAHNVIYKGVFMDHGGYANMNREIAFRLAEKPNINLKLDIIFSGRNVDKLTFEKLQYLSRRDASPKGAVNIVGFTPMATSKSSFNIMFTMMETETLHPNFAKTCNDHADMIMTPSQWNKDVFKKGGVKVPIKVVPLGVDFKSYRPNVSKLNITCREYPNGRSSKIKTSFNFITLFGWSYRKGIDVLLKSYCNAFTGDDDVGLIICSRYLGGTDAKSKGVVERDILKFMKMYPNPPRVYHYGESTPVDQMPNLLKNGDCFVWTSRGEGFGLPVVEAGALGMPVISTYNSAMTEFLTEDNSYLVHTDRFVVADGNLTCISPHYVGQLFPKLGKPCIDKFTEYMREVYQNYSESERKAKIFRSQIKEKYTWDVCANRVFEIINEIRGSEK